MRSPAGPLLHRRFALAVLLAAAAVPLVACGGGSQAKIETARHQLERGHLDRALAILEDADGPEAADLRATVAARRVTRASALAELENFRRSRADRELSELVAELRAMLAREDDPVVEEWIRQEMSSTTDWIAERGASRPRASSPVSGGPPTPPAEDALAAETRERLADLERARADGRWAEVLAEIERLRTDVPALAEVLLTRRDEVLEAAANEAASLVAAAEHAELEVGLEPAWNGLHDALWRFPSPPGEDGSIAALHAAEEDLRARMQAAAATAAAATPGAGGSPAEPPDFAADAHLAEEAGDLVRAAALWRDAAEAADDAAAREFREHRAWVLDRRRELREALADADVDWTEVEPVDVAALVGDRALPAGVLLGSCLERLRPSAHPATEEVHEGALDDLGTLVAEGALPESTAWLILAEYRREPVPAGGYRYVRGEWLTQAELESESRQRKMSRLVKEAVRADPARRAEIAAELGELAGESDTAELTELLRTRGEAAIDRMNVGLTWRRLEEVARAREQLDSLRAKALTLIADEERYFYPYNPPADPARSYADYVTVQREVTAAVEAVRALWDQDPAVDLPRDFREAAGMLAFVLGQPATWRGGLEVPADWPTWYPGVDLTAEALRLQTFAWTAAERERLRLDEAVVALSVRRSDAAGAGGPDVEERRMLELTNEYRRMLGRRALAWDARLFRACEWHSDYMAETGNFGHEEPDHAGRVTHLDRMQAAGYAEGWNENCQSGTEWARRAFDSWRASSEHHRNLISDVPREAAIARAGTYWTMNFGRGNDFENDLDPWRD